MFNEGSACGDGDTQRHGEGVARLEDEYGQVIFPCGKDGGKKVEIVSKGGEETGVRYGVGG